MNKVFLVGTLVLVASHQLRLAVGFSDPWLQLANWFTFWAAWRRQPPSV